MYHSFNHLRKWIETTLVVTVPVIERGEKSYNYVKSKKEFLSTKNIRVSLPVFGVCGQKRCDSGVTRTRYLRLICLSELQTCALPDELQSHSAMPIIGNSDNMSILRNDIVLLNWANHFVYIHGLFVLV